MSSSLKNRIKKIQRHLGVRADGIIGPVTLSKIEQAIGLPQDDYNLRVSLQGLKALVKFEVTSKANYERNLTKAVWPGGKSGATVGIGYDLGYASKRKIENDWKGLVSDHTLGRLLQAAGKTGARAKKEVSRMKRSSMKVPYLAAMRVFVKSTLPKYARLTRKAYPGVEELPPDAQTMLLSLIYNRGSSMANKSSRREMRAIRALVKNQDLDGIADQFIAMKRLWKNKGLSGILKRRDKEASLIRKARHRYKDSDIVLL